MTAAERLGVPILFAGVGEEIDALAPFDPEAYVEWLLRRASLVVAAQPPRA